MDYAIGQIIAWDSSSIPSGWAICNGQVVGAYTTPDLRGKFIQGASIDGDVGGTGGATTHTHTNPAATGNSPAHNHTAASVTYGTGASANAYGGSGDSASASSHRHGTSSFTINNNTSLHTHTLSAPGSGTNYPAYIKLLFIMKVS